MNTETIKDTVVGSAKSKTMWLAVFTFSIGYMELNSNGIIEMFGTHAAAYVNMGIGLAAGILRVVTTQAVWDKVKIGKDRKGMV